jgi:L-tartrate/succinate antiporter
MWTRQAHRFDAGEADGAENRVTLGYAVVVADAVLAPVTPSITARSGGIIYPIIRNVPVLYDSKPNDPSARRIGSYVMWLGVSAAMITSSLFLTGLAPNLLALEIVRGAHEHPN